MIAKQIKGQSFGGLLRYMEEKVAKGVGERIDSNMLGSTASELGKEFRLVSSQKPNLRKVVYHASLSLSKEDRKISNAIFVEIGNKYLKSMGFENSQFLTYRHTDREHQHIHMIANRVNLNFETVSDKWDYKRSEAAIRELELEYELKQVLSSNNVMEKSMTKAEVGLYKRKQVIPVRKQLQIITKDALQKATNLKEFEQLIIQSGVELQLHKNQKGNLFGASFQLDRVAMKASSLGKGYSINQINKKLKENERNRGIGEKASTRKDQNVGCPGGTHYENQPEEYSANEGCTSSYNRRNQQASDDVKIGGPDSNGATAKSGSHEPESHQLSRGFSQKAQRSSESQSFDKLQAHSHINIGGLNGGSDNTHSDSDDEIKKKLQKKLLRKKKGPSL